MQLSLHFQKEKIDTVSAAIALGKVKEKLLKLKNKDVEDFNQIKTMKKYIKELKDGKVEYKTICLKNLEAVLEACERKKSREIGRIQEAINSRVEENDNEFIIAICHILNCEGQEPCNAEEDINLELCDQHITHIINRFEKPLKNAGFKTADVIEEWHYLISYAIAFLNCSSTNYFRTWHCIFNSENCKIEFKNIILVAELAFRLPVSTAKLERSFLMLKPIKRGTRAALGVNPVKNLMRIS